MWNIVKMPIADWLPYLLPLDINIGFWLRYLLLVCCHSPVSVIFHANGMSIMTNRMFGVVWFLRPGTSESEVLMQSWYWEFAFIRKTSTQWWSQDSNEVSREFPLIEGWKGLIRHLTVFLCLIETDLWVRLVFATIFYIKIIARAIEKLIMQFYWCRWYTWWFWWG